MVHNKHNLALVNVNAHTKGSILSIQSQDIEQKGNLDLHQGQLANNYDVNLKKNDK